MGWTQKQYCVQLNRSFFENIPSTMASGLYAISLLEFSHRANFYSDSTAHSR